MKAMEMKAIQEMEPTKRAETLRETWGIEIEYSNSESEGYPMDILQKGQQIGRVLRSRGRVVIELEGIGDLDSDRAFSGGDALEIWDFQHHPNGRRDSDAVAERINVHIYHFVSVWAERQFGKNRDTKC